MRKKKTLKRDRRLQLVNKLRSLDTSAMSIKEIWNLPLEGMDMFHDYKTFWCFLQKFNIQYKKNEVQAKIKDLDTSSMTMNEIYSIVGGKKKSLVNLLCEKKIPYKRVIYRKK